MARLGVLLVGGLCALLLNMLYGGNSQMVGVVHTNVGGYTVVVTDCYRMQDPAVEHSPSDDDDVEVWRFAPCRNAVILIEGDQLSVNGVSYGAVAPGDEILVDHGAVYVNGQPRRTA